MSGDRSQETGSRRHRSQEAGPGDRSQETWSQGPPLPLLSACPRGSQGRPHLPSYDVWTPARISTLVRATTPPLGSTSTRWLTPTEKRQLLDCGGSREKRRSDLRISPRIQSPRPSSCILSPRRPGRAAERRGRLSCSEKVQIILRAR